MTQDRPVTPDRPAIQDRRVASDAAARERAIESNGSVLVQAPAGSGKTTLLAQRYLRLLALVDAPERILALTFTRRAAEEMRERVLLALGAAHLSICPPGMNRETWRLAVAASRHLHALHLDIQRQPSRLRIETIDAFNAWLAAQLPLIRRSGSRSASTRRREALLRRSGAPGPGTGRGRSVRRRRRSCAGARRSTLAPASRCSSPGCCRAATAGCRCWRDGCRRPARSMRSSCCGCAGTSMRTWRYWWREC